MSCRALRLANPYLSTMSVDIINDKFAALPAAAQRDVAAYIERLSQAYASYDPTERDRFWELIELIDLSADEDAGRLSALRHALAQENTTGIQAFQRELYRSLRALDGPRYFAAFANSEYGASADSFLYGRCFVVAQGQTIYEAVRATPAKFPPGVWLESLLYVAEDAFRDKTGEEMEFTPAVSIETRSNKELWLDSALEFGEYQYPHV